MIYSDIQSFSRKCTTIPRASTQSSRQTVSSFYRHQSSSGATDQAINRRYSRAFPVAGPKTWNALPENVTSSQSEYRTPFASSLKRGFSGSLFRISSSDTDCILNFSLRRSLPAFRRFCCLRSTIWYDMIPWFRLVSLYCSVEPW